MWLKDSLIVSLTVFNAFIFITCLKYPPDYERRAANKRPIARVIDGVDADRREYAYVVALEMFPGAYIPRLNFTQYRTCTGSLINKLFVISAAHCSKGADRIRYGDLTVPSSSTRASHSNITRKFIHVKYEYHLIRPDKINKKKSDLRFLMKNDIALYKVEPVNLSKYADLSAVDYKTLTGLPVRYVGLGRSFSIKMNKKEIKKRRVEDGTRERQIGYAVVKPCGKLSSTVHIYPMICLARKCNSIQDSSNGDSGGPLFYAGKIVGMLMGHPIFDGLIIDSGSAVYTPVSVYMDWITHVINAEN